MQLKATLISALVGASTVLAADSTPSQCSFSATATATAQADLDKLASCKTISGDLLITGALGNAALANVQEIDGSLTINNATNLVNFAADSLQKISGSLNLQSLTVLSSASFGSLETVDSIKLVTLPAIDTFTTNLKTAKSIYISDTSLQSIDSFAVLREVDVFNINNNKYLSSVKSSLQTVSDALQFSFNGDSTSIVFDNLIWANNITLNDVANASFASLASVNASLGFINNSLTSIELSNLTSVGQTFTIASNDDLTDVNFSNLTTVGGGFVIANNTKLRNIDSFNKVSTIGGALNVVGNFTSLDLSSLKSVRGGANVQTSSGNFSCDPLKKLQSKGGIQGDAFVCKNGARSSSSSSISSSASSSGSSSKSSSSQSSTATDDSNSNSTSTATSTSSKKAGKSKNAALPQVIPTTSVFGFIAAVVAALL